MREERFTYVVLGEAEIYYNFLKSYGIKPEDVRNMPVYDVYMLLACEIGNYINEKYNERQSKFKKASGTTFPGLEVK